MGLLSKNYYSVSPGTFNCRVSLQNELDTSPHKSHIYKNSETLSINTDDSSVFTLRSNINYPLTIEQNWDFGVAKALGLDFLIPLSYNSKEPKLVQKEKESSTLESNISSVCISEKDIIKSSLNLYSFGPNCVSLLLKQISIKSLSSLVQLDISYNDLESLPDDFGFYFPQLKHLSLEKNNLLKLPDSICSLYSLSILVLDSNKVKSR